jgi:hypothetical protein
LQRNFGTLQYSCPGVLIMRINQTGRRTLVCMAALIVAALVLFLLRT